jgi:hypothetical protein
MSASSPPRNPIPKGIEVLIKKAAVDEQFRASLLDLRADAAGLIDLKLEPPEIAMLSSASRVQLESIISNTSVPDSQRRVFLGKVAALMLAAIGIGSAGCYPATTGIAPDPPQKKNPEPEPGPERPTHMPVTDGIRPDMPPDTDRIPITGSKPDMPPGASK